jgi:hypothetical protein
MSHSASFVLRRNQKTFDNLLIRVLSMALSDNLIYEAVNCSLDVEKYFTSSRITNVDLSFYTTSTISAVSVKVKAGNLSASCRLHEIGKVLPREGVVQSGYPMGDGQMLALI